MNDVEESCHCSYCTAAREPKTRNKWRVRKTLALIPDEVVLDVASREMELWDGESCLVGTAVRSMLSEMTGLPFESISGDLSVLRHTAEDEPCSPIEHAANLFGGDENDWEFIYSGVIGSDDIAFLIETEFTNRVLNAVERA